MIRNVLLPLLALAGGVFAGWTVATGSKPAPVAPPVSEPARPPFDSYIAGSGLIEARSRNIAIASPLPLVVKEVAVRPGDEVKAGGILFLLSDRVSRANVEVRRSALASARARIERLLAAPRPEELPPAQARVTEAEAVLADLKHQVSLWEAVADRRAVSAEDLSRKKFAASAAESRLVEARSRLALLQAGAWKPELEVARAELAEAGAQIAAAEADLERHTVRAPLDGTVLQVNVRAGEFAPAGALETPLILFGATDRLHLRVDVDENDAWRFPREGRAVAFARGNRELKTELRFERVEPYVIPKRSLTGDSTERVDTRVMQAVYSFERAALPIYLGQQMDVYIELHPGGTKSGN